MYQRLYLKLKTPARGGGLVGASGTGEGLVEADAGYVSSFDGVGSVVVLFREGYGEVLDAVFETDLLEELNEVAESLDEVVIAFVGLDVA